MVEVKRHNPGNIRKGSPWVGLAPVQDDSGFCTFIDDAHGIRAMAVILHAYFGRGTDTVSKIINTWAPSQENNTIVYIEDVCNWTGWTADQVINLADPMILRNLVAAIIHQEQGTQPYNATELSAGIALACF